MCTHSVFKKPLKNERVHARFISLASITRGRKNSSERIFNGLMGSVKYSTTKYKRHNAPNSKHEFKNGRGYFFHSITGSAAYLFILAWKKKIDVETNEQ